MLMRCFRKLKGFVRDSEMNEQITLNNIANLELPPDLPTIKYEIET